MSNLWSKLKSTKGYEQFKLGHLGEVELGMFIVRTAISDNSVDGFNELPEVHKETLVNFIKIYEDKGKFEIVTSSGVKDHTDLIVQFKELMHKSDCGGVTH